MDRAVFRTTVRERIFAKHGSIATTRRSFDYGEYAFAQDDNSLQ